MKNAYLLDLLRREAARRAQRRHGSRSGRLALRWRRQRRLRRRCGCHTHFLGRGHGGGNRVSRRLERRTLVRHSGRLGGHRGGSGRGGGASRGPNGQQRWRWSLLRGRRRCRPGGRGRRRDGSSGRASELFLGEPLSETLFADLEVVLLHESAQFTLLIGGRL